MLVNLNNLLPEAAKSTYAIPCFNVFGYEDAKAVVDAAEELQMPVIIGCSKDVVEFYGLETVAGMLLSLMKKASVPICFHLDHTYEEDIIYKAMQVGFTSVMFDGSQLTLEENIKRTRQVAEVAHALGISIEGEIGSVPYEEGRDHIKSIDTNPEDAARFVLESGIDCVAVSVGNIHRLTSYKSTINFDLFHALERSIDVPLVIHGTSGIADEDIRKLKSGRVAKFNIGTTLRQELGNNLRKEMNAEPDKFDRLYFMSKVIPYVKAEAMRNLKLLAK